MEHDFSIKVYKPMGMNIPGLFDISIFAIKSNLLPG
ncbi:hypothetical protein NTGHW29_360010 [Candidatus Nitrotoga sp. HW29]|nr:hypothetical protein NTGHW29_360010 [Candidatus Nitrotoga sp. HW29]